MEMYREHLAACPLLKEMEEGILSKLCLKMSPYLALRGDLIVKEGDVGEEMYMVIRGCIKLTSQSNRLYNERNWEDGAFFGEMAVLGIGGGPEANRHVYSATAFIDSDCIFITEKVITDLQILYPTFKRKMRTMATKRAQRYGKSMAAFARLTMDSSAAPAAKLDTPAVDAVTHLDSSMNDALHSFARRSRATSSTTTTTRSSNQRESRQALNLLSNQATGDNSPTEARHTASSQLKHELRSAISGASSATPERLATTTSTVHEEVRLLRQEVSSLSQLLKQSMVNRPGQQGEDNLPLPSASTDAPGQPSSPPSTLSLRTPQP